MKCHAVALIWSSIKSLCWFNSD